MSVTMASGRVSYDLSKKYSHEIRQKKRSPETISKIEHRQKGRQASHHET